MALPSSGRYDFTRDEAMRALGLNRKAFVQAARRLLQRKKIARVHGRFYVVVPLEHAAVGVIPPDWFVSNLMEHLRRPFYVGVLRAAELHGAAHQRPQWYHVVTNRPVRDITCRGVGIRFFVKQNAAATPVRQVKTVAGFIPVSTPEATAIDLVRYSRRIGGLDHVLTVLQELGPMLDEKALVKSAKLDGNLAYAQRLGWLLERAGQRRKARALAQWLAREQPSLTRLEPSLPIKGAKRDERWGLYLNTDVEGDL